MRESVKRFPEKDFDVPEGIVFVNIDKNTGKLSEGDPRNSVYEAFIEGSEPKIGNTDVSEIGQKDESEALDEEEEFFKKGY